MKIIHFNQEFTLEPESLDQSGGRANSYQPVSITFSAEGEILEENEPHGETTRTVRIDSIWIDSVNAIPLDRTNYETRTRDMEVLTRFIPVLEGFSTDPDVREWVEDTVNQMYLDNELDDWYEEEDETGDEDGPAKEGDE